MVFIRFGDPSLHSIDLTGYCTLEEKHIWVCICLALCSRNVFSLRIALCVPQPRIFLLLTFYLLFIIVIIIIKSLINILWFIYICLSVIIALIIIVISFYIFIIISIIWVINFLTFLERKVILLFLFFDYSFVFNSKMKNNIKLKTAKHILGTNVFLMVIIKSVSTKPKNLCV